MKKANFYTNDSGIMYAVIGEKTYSVGFGCFSIYDSKNVIDKEEVPATEDEFFGAIEDLKTYLKHFEKEVEGAQEWEQCQDCWDWYPLNELEDGTCAHCLEEIRSLNCDPAFISWGDSYNQ